MTVPIDQLAGAADAPKGIVRSAAGHGKPLPPGPLPRGVSLSAMYGGVVALAVLLTGLAAVYEAVLSWKLIGGTRPSAWLADVFDGVAPTSTIFWISVALVCVGLLVFITSMKRRPPRAYKVKAQTGVYLRHTDAGRLLERDLRLLPGVVGVRVRASVRRLRVQVESTGGPETGDDVREAIERRLRHLQTPPKVKYELSTARTKGEVTS